MTEKTDKPVVETGRYTEPRAKNDPGHKDAGQLYVERDEAQREEAEKAAQEVLDAFKAEGPTQTEIDAAQNSTYSGIVTASRTWAASVASRTG